MYTHIPRRGSHPRTAARQAAARLRRLAAALAAITCAVLAAAAVPAASAHTLVRDPPGGAPAAAGPGPSRRSGHQRHGGLADHLDRARRGPDRGHRRGVPGPGAGRPPGRLRTHRVTQPHTAWAGHTPRPGCTAGCGPGRRPPAGKHLPISDRHQAGRRTQAGIGRGCARCRARWRHSSPACPPGSPPPRSVSRRASRHTVAAALGSSRTAAPPAPPRRTPPGPQPHHGIPGVQPVAGGRASPRQ